MSNLRKDNYAKATVDAGTVYGKVLSVSKTGVVLATPSGTASVDRATTERVSVDEYKANAVAATAETFSKADETAAAAATPKGVVKPGAKGTGKKAVAKAVFTELTVDGVIPTRKAFSTAMAERTGLSAKGASTYFYNLKSGRWA